MVGCQSIDEWTGAIDSTAKLANLVASQAPQTPLIDTPHAQCPNLHTWTRYLPGPACLPSCHMIPAMH